MQGKLPIGTALFASALVLAGCAGGNGPNEAGEASPPTTTPAPSVPAATTATPSRGTTTTTTPVTSPTTSPATPSRRPGPVAPTGFQTVATGLDVPWGLAFLDDGSALVSERDSAQIVHVAPSGEVTAVGEVAGVDPGGEGGLLGIAIDNDFLYAYFTSNDDNRVVRMPFSRASLGDPEVVIDGIPKGGMHNGGRITFGPDGMLFIATGDSSEGDLSQDRESLAGKILRVAPDGSVPDGNPFPGSPVWSYGHRNVQGLAFDDADRLWASEFGQSTWDELNLIEPGANYGWPDVEGASGDGEYVDPVAQWSTDEASPSGIAYVRDTIFMAALRGQRLWQIPVPGGRAGEPQDFAVEEYGRLRHVALAPDGTLWVLTNNTDGRGDPRAGDDRILEVTVG